MEEKIETQPEEIVEEQPKAGFLEKLKIHKFKILGGVLGSLVFAGAVFGAYRLGQRRFQLAPQPTPTPIVEATPTPDPTADWKTYTNTEVGFSFKYPQTLALSECKDGLHLFEATSELESSEFCETPPLGKISLDYATTPFSLGYSQSLDFETKEEQITVGGVRATRQTVNKIKEAPGPDYAVFVIFSKDNYYFVVSLRDKQYESTFNLMLSTFRFLEPSTVSPSPIPVTQNYPRPSSWKTVTIPSMEISLCLPPKWVVGTDHYLDDYREIFFERDPNYRPVATSISKIPYSGGSRRDEYINSKVQYEYEPEKLKKETTVKEIIINGRSVLNVAIPTFSEELVFVMNDYLYGVGIDRNYQVLVNDSAAAYRKDIYTIVGCIKPI